MTRPAAISTLLQAVAIMAAGKFLFAIQDVIIKQMSGAYPALIGVPTAKGSGICHAL